MPPLARLLAVGALIGAAAEPSAWAAEPAPSGSAVVSPKPAVSGEALSVFVELSATPVIAEEVRTALETELRVAVVLVAERAAEGLSVSVQGRRVTVSFRGKHGETTRSLDLPADPQKAVEVIALLAGNLARDEASELLARLAPPPEPAPVASAPDATQSAPEPAGASTPSPAKPASSPSAVERRSKVPPARHEPAAARDFLLREPSANLTLYHPLTLLSDTERRVLAAELGATYSRAGAVEGAAFSIGYLRVDHHLDGFAGTFGWTRVDATARGLQLGGLVSEGHGPLRGVELANLVAIRTADADGLQVAGLVSVARDVRGAQLGMLAAVARDVHGVQAGLVNVARDVNGVELALVDVARDVNGAELGLVNVAKSADVQIGLVNVAERVDGAAIGLVSIAGNGSVQPLGYAIGGTRVSYNAGVKFVAGFAYSQIALGSTGTERSARFRTEAGLGLHLEPSWLRGGSVVDRAAFELGAHSAHVYLSASERRERDEDQLHYRAGIGARFVKRVWFFGGWDVSHDVDSFAQAGSFAERLGHGPWAGLALF